jgi:hypothetical protein
MIRVKPRFAASLGGIPPSPVAWLAIEFLLFRYVKGNVIQ